jgi:hypothetical protein
VPTILAAIIILFASQMLFGRKHFWLPQLLAKRSVSAEHLQTAIDKDTPFRAMVGPMVPWTPADAYEGTLRPDRRHRVHPPRTYRSAIRAVSVCE